MSPTSPPGGAAIAAGTSVEVPALPMPSASSPHQAWPTFTVDPSTRLAVSAGSLPKITLRPLLGSTTQSVRSATQTLPPPASTSPIRSARRYGMPVPPSVPMRTAGPMPGPGAPTNGAGQRMTPPAPVHGGVPTQLPGALPSGMAAFAPPTQPGFIRQSPPSPIRRSPKAGQTLEQRASRSSALGSWGLALSFLAVVTALGVNGGVEWAVLGVVVLVLTLTSVPAIRNGLHVLAGYNPTITPIEVRRCARKGISLGWIGIALWTMAILILLAHVL